MSNYPTNLTEKQWQVIKNIVEPQERNRKNPLREIVNGIFYVNKSGCQWRMLPSDFAPWQTVYYYFRKWKFEGGWERTFSWLENYRRLTIDYEFLTETAEAMVSIAFIQIALNRFF